jgi:UDP-N-acetylglucosamine--N-acetylmuramyl-(pentapeptide) pyrophosphoryl-undecaprenol N-acetylglucosamine transferase
VRVLIAGGGTGGHLFPGIALAEEIVTRHVKNDVIFVGTDRGLEARVVPQNGFAFETIPARGLKGMGVLEFLAGVLTVPLSLLISFQLLKKFKPDVVVGVGGYSSGPLVLAAWMLRIPTAISEQNAMPGLTNRILAGRVDAAFLSFEAARPFFKKSAVHVLGNPIRRKLLENFLRPTSVHKDFTILILGGSLGAKGLNTRMIDALPHLLLEKANIRLVHQTGRHDFEAVKKAYSTFELSAEVVEFIDDMAQAYLAADLIVCRAGATTLAELSVCKKASILVPFPFATDDHQAVNAQALVEVGAALMFREEALTGEKLAATILELKADAARRKKMEKAAGSIGRPEAAREIADVLQQMCLEKWGSLKGQERTGEPLRPKDPT